ncbi:hypothetical protein Tco_0524062 [Tanacetum coccineum]
MSTPATAEEKTKKKNDVKARGLLLMALPNEHQLTFSQVSQDDKSMFVPIETKFGSSSSTNDANTASSQVSAASPSVNTASPQVCTASVSDNTMEVQRIKKQGNHVPEIKDNTREARKLKEEYFNGNVAIDDLEFEKLKQEKDAIDFKIKKFSKASKNLDQLLGSQITDNSKKGFGYCAVPLPHPLIYNRPNKLDLSYYGLDEFKEPEFKGYGPENSCGSNTSKNVSEVEPKKVRKNNDAPIIEDWVLDDEEQDESKTKPKKKTVIPTAAKIEKLVKRSIGMQKCIDHKVLEGIREIGMRNCTYHQKKKVVSGNNYNRVDNYYYAKTSHHRTHKNVTPRAVLLRTSLKPLSTAKLVYTAHPKPTVHCARPKTHFYKSAQSTVQRPFYKKPTLTNRHFNHKVNTVRPRIVNTARSYRTPVNTVRPRVAYSA